MGKRLLLRNRWAALGIVATGAVAAAASIHFLAPSQSESDQAGAENGGGSGPGLVQDRSANVGAEQTYIVVYNEQPLATYDGSLPGLAAPARMKGRSGVASNASVNKGLGRIDVEGRAARNYVRHLQDRQASHESRINGVVGRRLQFRQRMQHALNGAVVRMSEAEAKRVESMAEVKFVEPYQEFELHTDVGPSRINAPALWTGSPNQYRGEGMVIGIIDTGINFGSPSFAATDQTGYTHTNPLGAGNYLGTCAPGGVDEGRCNDKLIGGYDFVCNFGTSEACANTSLREEPGFGDTNNHGSHVASTAAGNVRNVALNYTSLTISGVAPRANIVAYDTCFTQIATGQGSCPNVATAAAVNQAVADGIVDVLNFSIGGGVDPWRDATSMAMLNAADAGIYIATSAGNSGPGRNTDGHRSPWVASTAATQTGRQSTRLLGQVTGPGEVPEALRAIALSAGVGALEVAPPIAPTTPLKLSEGIDSTNDGCEAYPADHFSGAIAVVRRGTCDFTTKVNNAAGAGAVAVWIANNTDAAISPTVTGTTIPSFGMRKPVADAVRDFVRAAGGSATGMYSIPAVDEPNLRDAIATFSSRGGAATLDLLKPDISAPGVAILAATAGTTITGFENATGMISGTSMASPHHAGAAALLKQAKPDWTVHEIKSALMMTAFADLKVQDGSADADPFAKGAGLIQLDKALLAGLVLNETKANFLAADPFIGGDVTTLNQPSMAKRGCAPSCSFTRVFRNTLGTRQSWTAKLQGVTGVISPALITLGPGETKAVKVTVTTGNYPSDSSFHFGRMVLSPQGGNATQPPLQLPIAVSVLPPTLSATTPANTVTLPAGSNGVLNLKVTNIGGPSLAWQLDNTGSGTRVLVARAPNNQNGLFSTRFTNAAAAGVRAMLATDDFELLDATRIDRIAADGFINGATLASTTNINWSIYRDVNGNPEGNPETSPQAAVWSHTAPFRSAGVSTSGLASINLDLAAAGQTVNLPAGKYWLVVSVRASTSAIWVWFNSPSGDGSRRGLTVGTDGSGLWVPDTAHPGLAFQMRGSVACGATWIGTASRASGNLAAGASQTTQVQISAAGLAAGTYRGHVCVSSNDPQQAKAPVPIVLNVTP